MARRTKERERPSTRTIVYYYDAKGRGSSVEKAVKKVIVTIDRAGNILHREEEPIEPSAEE